MTTAVEPALIPGNEAQRMEAVRRYDILDTPPDGAFDRITALAARLFDVPIAIVSVVDHDRIWFKAHYGLETTQIDRDPGLCASAILHEGPWIVENAPADPRALANPLVAGAFGLKFYAGVPLRTDDGYNLGTLCILDYKAREISAAEVTTLEDLAGMVMSELEVRLSSRKALAEASEREQLKDAFLGMLSHEFRTPVTTIYAAAQLLSRDKVVMADTRLRSLFPDIAAESERLLRLVDDLLVLTRIERGVLEAEHEPVLLQRVLPKVIDRERRRYDGRSVRLDVPTDLPPALCDQTFLEQVLANLLSNAFKYSDPLSEVEVEVVDRGEELEVRVRDRGIGMETNELESAFDLLYRSPEAKLIAPGAGVGLYVCRQLVETMGGRVWIAPKDGQGTSIAFTVPRADLDGLAMSAA